MNVRRSNVSRRANSKQTPSQGVSNSKNSSVTKRYVLFIKLFDFDFFHLHLSFVFLIHKGSLICFPKQIRSSK